SGRAEQMAAAGAFALEQAGGAAGIAGGAEPGAGGKKRSGRGGKTGGVGVVEKAGLALPCGKPAGPVAQEGGRGGERIQFGGLENKVMGQVIGAGGEVQAAGLDACQYVIFGA